MTDEERETTNTEPHLHSDMQLAGEQATVVTEREVEPRYVPGSVTLRLAGFLLRCWTWAFLVIGLLTPLAQWSWLGELGANCGRHVIIALLPGLLVFRRERLAGLLICLALVAVSWPWARQAWEERATPIAAAGAEPFKVMVANMGWWNQEEPQVVADAILAADVDILVLVEATEDVVDALLRSDRWNRWHRRSAKNELGPYSIAIATSFDRVGSDRTLSITGPERSDGDLEEQGMTGIDTVPVPVMRLEQNTRPFLLIGLHPPPPTRPSLWRHQAAVMRAVLDRIADADEPVILAGDWNATPASASWQAAYADGLRRAPGSATNSWFFRGLGGLRPLLGLPIDRVAERGFHMGAVETMAIPGSDHLALIYTLQLPAETP